MLCIGETLKERESNHTQKVLSEQIHKSLAKVDKSKELVVAYEPVWAIGTGVVATPDQVSETHKWVKEILVSLGLEDTPILYGGSVKPENAEELMRQEYVSGFLVGGASLVSGSFVKICRT